jgi:hypothetical protein
MLDFILRILRKMRTDSKSVITLTWDATKVNENQHLLLLIRGFHFDLPVRYAGIEAPRRVNRGTIQNPPVLKREARSVPRATDGAAFEFAFTQWSAQMGTDFGDCEDALLSPGEKDPGAPHIDSLHRPFCKVGIR